MPGSTLESPGEEWSRQRAGSPRDLPDTRACVLKEKKSGHDGQSIATGVAVIKGHDGVH